MPNSRHLCPCCHLNSISVRQVCGDCELHQGNTGPKMVRRDRDHVLAWKKDQARLLAQLERVTQGFERQLEEMRTELTERPTHTVYENLDAETVQTAARERDRALKARDIAFRLVAQFRGLHHDTGRGTCSCRQPVERCEETKIIDSSTSYRRWEARAGDAYRKGHASQLPPEHPYRTDSHWSQPAA
jgi:hypothetical protein